MSSIENRSSLNKSAISSTLRQPLRWALLPAALGLCSLLLPSAAEAARKKKADHAIVAGKVLNQAGEVLSGIAVEASGAAEFSATATSDKKGRFEIRIPEPSGEYLFRLGGPGYATFETELTVAPGDRQNLDFSLLDAATGQRMEAVALYNEAVGLFNRGDRAGAKGKLQP